jgi:hypothetical protein
VEEGKKIKECPLIKRKVSSLNYTLNNTMELLNIYWYQIPDAKLQAFATGIQKKTPFQKAKELEEAKKKVRCRNTVYQCL